MGAGLSLKEFPGGDCVLWGGKERRCLVYPVRPTQCQTFPFWQEHVILTFSLSKLGLPGTRTGIVIASPEIISVVSSINAVISLASGNVGQALVVPTIEDGRILDFSRQFVRPFYQSKLNRALAWVAEFFDDMSQLHIQTAAAGH